MASPLADPSFLLGILATLAAQWLARKARRLRRTIARRSRKPEPPPRLYPSLNDPAVWPKVRRRKAR